MKTPLRALEPALQHYGVKASAARQIHEGFNYHFQLTTSAGEKRLIVFRRQPGKPPRDFQFNLWQHMRAGGFTLIPPTLKTASGRDYAGTPLGTVALVDWVPGQSGSTHRDWSGPLLSDAAGVLADLHAAVRDFRPERAGADQLAPLYLPADAWVDRSEALFADFCDRTAPTAGVADAVRMQMQGARDRFDGAAYRTALEAGTAVVHGDYRPGNLVLDDGRIVGVLDLDAAFWESRVYDVAYAAFQFAGDEGVYPQPSAATAVDFVRHYTQRWPLTPAERALLPFFLRQVVLKRLLAGHDTEPRLALLEQLDNGLEEDLVRAAA